MPNGEIIAYNVNIFYLEDNMLILMNTTSASATTFMATDFGKWYFFNALISLNPFLEPGVPYRIEVLAINSKGPGQSTSKISFTKELGEY